MIYNSSIKKLACLIICSLAVLFGLTGCGKHDYKAEADEMVYDIIDQKWKDDFGSKVNYKISDTAPLPNDIKIEKTIPASGMLTLPKAVAMATAHNRQYQLEKELLYTTALDLRLARHDFEPWFFGSGGVGYATIDGDDGVGSAANFGLNQLLVTGARISTQVAINWVRILTGDLEGGLLTSVLSANVTQPLLRGSNRKVVMEDLTQAERNTLYQIRQFNRFRKTFVVSVISQYYRVLQFANTVKNAENNYNTILEVYAKVEKLANAGRLPLLELERVRQEKLQAKDTLVQAQKEYKQVLDEFKFLQLSLAANIEFRLDVNELKVLRFAEMSKPPFSETEAIETALQARLDLANRIDAVADARRKVFVAADSLGAELNLNASASMPSRELGTSETKDLPDVFMADLELNLPLDRVAEQNVYRKALITLNQRKREKEEASDLVALEIRRAYRNLIETAERYRVQLESTELAQKRFKDTSLLLQYGRASSRRVLNAQGDLFDAQNAATEAMVGYTIAMLNFYRDTGVLQVKPDGMWQIPKTVPKPAFARDNYVPNPRQTLQTISSEATIKCWMQNQKTVAKPAFARDNYVPTPRQTTQTVSSEATIKRWMQNLKTK